MPTCKYCDEKFGLIELRDGKCKACRTKEETMRGHDGTARCNECGLPTDIDELMVGDGQCEYCRKGKPSSSKLSPLSSHSGASHTQHEASSRIIMTTGPTIPVREISEIVQIVASEVALGMNIFKDIANSWRDTFGGRSSSVQKALKDAREACLMELRAEAAACGADAVVAVRLDYSEISTGGGTGGSILFVAATGTAVLLKDA